MTWECQRPETGTGQLTPRDVINTVLTQRDIVAKAGKGTDPSSVEAIGRRLLQTRKVLGLTTTEMCRHMGSTTTGSAYSNYEMGKRRISLDHALALCKLGLTLDWIYRGQIASRLEASITRRLQELLSPSNNGG